MRIAIVAGARPNFMKAAPLTRVSRDMGIEALLIHTGQHYDEAMSKVFFEELGLPRPHRHLGVGSGTHGEVTARCLERLESALVEDDPDRVVVVGDVNSTLAGALAAAKLRIPLAHVEAGLRSFDRNMPEEINRVVTDAVSDLLFVTESSGVTNLANEGRPEEAIHLVGNVMIDTLERLLPLAKERKTARKMGLSERSYALCTLHRPSNVDRPEDLKILCNHLERVQKKLPIYFPVHPRTRERIRTAGMLDLLSALPGMHLMDPMGYLDFLSLMATSRVVLTDSGGIQEETTVLGIPCLTVRDNTERPITVEQGSNLLVGARGERLEHEIDKLLDGSSTKAIRPELWDGQAANRIMRILRES